MAENRVIGLNNRLPWHLPADLQHFKQLTLDKPVVMGRNTFASLGKPLPKRDNWVLSRQGDFSAPGCKVAHAISDILALDAPEMMIIGGGQIYQQFLPLACQIYLTVIHTHIAGDTWFPELDAHWGMVEQTHHPQDARHAQAFSFQVWRKHS